MKTRILLAALPMAVLLGACDNPSGPGEGESLLTLSYSGGVTGTFRAVGDPDGSTATNAQTFAIGHRYPAEGRFEVIAYSQSGGNRYDMASLAVPLAGVGTAAISWPCLAEHCAGLGIAIDLTRTNGSIAVHTCHLHQGTIRITDMSETRASGTVSGTGFCNPGGGGDQVPFQITSGSFDVDVMQH
ncbi:MAG TPA: hypothetical protein VEQ60_18710 [Longimicrobium sp.]|nr:hypothetical protein [Longimicrobium sp.]